MYKRQVFKERCYCSYYGTWCEDQSYEVSTINVFWEIPSEFKTLGGFFCERGRAGKCLCPDTASVSVTLSFREFAKSMAEKFKLAFWAQTVNFSAITQISES